MQLKKKAHPHAIERKFDGGRPGDTQTSNTEFSQAVNMPAGDVWSVAC